jgi:hypothetical protein
VDTCPTVDESFARLHAAGWSVGDVRLATAAGSCWLVTGHNGENSVRARGDTWAEAWHRNSPVEAWVDHRAPAHGSTDGPETGDGHANATTGRYNRLVPPAHRAGAQPFLQGRR